MFRGILGGDFKKNGVDYSAQIAALEAKNTELSTKVATLSDCCASLKALLVNSKPSYATNQTLNSSPYWGDYHVIKQYNESLLVSKIDIFSVVRVNQIPQKQLQFVKNGVVLGYLWIPNTDLDTNNSRLVFSLNGVRLQFYTGVGSEIAFVNGPSVAYYAVDTDYSISIKTITY
jgi:hypothetical protein